MNSVEAHHLRFLEIHSPMVYDLQLRVLYESSGTQHVFKRDRASSKFCIKKLGPNSSGVEISVFSALSLINLSEKVGQCRPIN